MNNVNEVPVVIEDERDWANGYRESFTPELSWQKFAMECGVAAGTLQPFCKGNYAGRNDLVAGKIFKFRQTIESRERQKNAIPVDPGYFETETSRRLHAQLEFAHLGRITVAATGPGTGKTKTMDNYAECASRVWRVTMMPSAAKLYAMIKQVQIALKMDVRHNDVSGASRAVMGHLEKRTNGLIVVDEAQHLGLEAFDELRTWHDLTGVGIAFLGNDTLLDRIESGRQSDAFARLNSRIGDKHIQQTPVIGDVSIFCDAWQIHDPAMRKFLQRIAMTRSAGGLRECRALIESAGILALADNRGLELADLQDANSTRATRWVKA